jgi:hypothetical protein
MSEEARTPARVDPSADEERGFEVAPRGDEDRQGTSPFELVPSPANARKPQKVLFIMGMTRSGSTVLDNVLGEIEGFFSAGEMRLIWKRGVLESRSCGCGLPVLECPVWREVLADAYGKDVRRTLDAKADAALRTQRTAVRIRHTWGLLRRNVKARPPERLREYVSLVAPLYRSIGAMTGAGVIIDSSKRPSDAALLRLVPGLDVYVLHLVRDPRAVAYSWRRTRAQPDPNGPATLSRNGTIHSTTRWMYRNAAAEAVIRTFRSDRVFQLRYESFVADPQETVRSMIRFLEEEGPGPVFLDDGSVELGTNHTVSGNPSRFRIGAVRITDDREWERRQRIRHRIIATAVALPFLRRYGYPVRP